LSLEGYFIHVDTAFRNFATLQSNSVL